MNISIFGISLVTASDKTMAIRSIKIHIIATMYCLCVVWWLSKSGQDRIPYSRHRDNSETRLILFGNTFWGDTTWEIGEGSEVFANCPVNNCYLTSDKSRIAKSDAVLFHVHEVDTFPEYERPIKQRWVFFMLESPQFSANTVYRSEPWRSAFNWTMTYKLDSDIPIPYGHIERVPRKSTKDYLTISKSKSRLVAWFASNCHTNSKRELYVRELARYLTVDVIGVCGRRVCARNYSGGDEECQTLINNTFCFICRSKIASVRIM